MPRAVKSKPRVQAIVSDNALWAAVVARDKSCDGQFVLAVKTTGIYCRPGCPARLPKRENVQFHANCAAAEAAGFRACKRCKPKESNSAKQDAAKIAQACRLIETSEEIPKLDELAAGVGLSPFHVHRLFKALTGVTPKAYADAHRQTKIHKALAKTPTVTQALLESGFNSNSRFYATSTQMLGMTPKEYKAGGANTDITFAVGDCSLGKVLVAATPVGVCAVLIGDDSGSLQRDLQDRFPKASITRGDKTFGKLVARVVTAIETPGQASHLPLDVRGSVFQHKVWRALREIPAGTTISYAELAQRIGKPKAVRAVASACGANPVAVVIPCHRVVGRDGSLSGYRWGIDRKRKLLASETKKLKTKAV
jgi:AraC family transcriptional regulator, regulatory protein of adaptative response / methylated-DNA-[protein]-cysteine methyltransferase